MEWSAAKETASMALRGCWSRLSSYASLSSLLINVRYMLRSGTVGRQIVMNSVPQQNFYKCNVSPTMWYVSPTEVVGHLALDWCAITSDA